MNQFMGAGALANCMDDFNGDSYDFAEAGTSEVEVSVVPTPVHDDPVSPHATGNAAVGL